MNTTNSIEQTLPLRTPDFLTVEEVAEMFKVKPRTVYAWIADKERNKIPVEKIGGSVRFRLDRILKWSEGRNED